MIPLAEIDWGALAQAAYISVVVGLGVMLVAAVAVTFSLRSQDAKASGHAAASTAYITVTAVCVLALVAAVVIGISFMTDK